MRFKGKRRVGRPERIEDHLDQALRQLGAAPDTVPLAVLRVWPSVVGALAARSTQPVRLFRGKLVVHAVSEVWVAEMVADSGPLLARLAKAVGRPVAHSLHVRVGPLLTAPPPPPPHAAATAVPIPAEVEQMVASLDDPALQESVRRAVGWSLGRPRAK